MQRGTFECKEIVLLEKSEITPKNILITDDEQINIKILNKILVANGHTIIVALNGEECIEKAKKRLPDLILLDIMMPFMDGIEACKILKNDPVTRNIPIIFVTADTSSSVLKKAFEAGGTDYVRKPVNVVEFKARVDSVLLHQELIKNHIQDEKLKGSLAMAGTICHELNQPLQYIYSASQLLLMDLPKGSQEHAHVSKILENVDKMAAITKKLMGITSFKTRAYVGETKILDIERS